MNEVYKGTFNYRIAKDTDFWGRYEITVSKGCNTDCSSVGVENEVFLNSKIETKNVLYDRPAFLEKLNHAIALKAQRKFVFVVVTPLFWIKFNQIKAQVIVKNLVSENVKTSFHWLNYSDDLKCSVWVDFPWEQYFEVGALNLKARSRWIKCVRLASVNWTIRAGPNDLWNTKIRYLHYF